VSLLKILKINENITFLKLKIKGQYSFILMKYGEKNPTAKQPTY